MHKGKHKIEKEKQLKIYRDSGQLINKKPNKKEFKQKIKLLKNNTKQEDCFNKCRKDKGKSKRCNSKKIGKNGIWKNKEQKWKDKRKNININ